MTKDDRYGAAGDSYGSSGDSYGTPSEPSESSGASRNGHADASTDAQPEADGDSDGLGDLPFIFARRTVKADRDALPVYVRDVTAEDIDALERELESRFDGDDVMSLDVREAVVKAGLRTVDDVVDVMEEWGYGRR